MLKVADDPNGSPKALERLLERDPAMSAKILKVANSAYYGHSHIPSVGRAISVLGINTIRSLVTAVGFQQMVGAKSAAPSLNKLNFWRHSLGTATAARILGKLRLPLKAEELFSAGLMHDIGILVMERFMPAELEQVLKRMNEDFREMHEIEQEMLGFTHAEVGAMLAEKWNLTPVLSNAIHYHHNVMEDEVHQETTAIVAAANVIAQQCTFSTAPMRGRKPEFDFLSAQLIDMPEDQLEVIRNVLIQEVNRAQEAFNLSNAA